MFPHFHDLYLLVIISLTCLLYVFSLKESSSRGFAKTNYRTTKHSNKLRKLIDIENSPNIYSLSNMKPVYIIAGNFTINKEEVNLAQYDIHTDTWTKKYKAELSAVESNGVILDITIDKSTNSYDKLYIVGLFDTMTRTSQTQFCSVGSWNGALFEKVGEGLCPRGNSPSVL